MPGETRAPGLVSKRYRSPSLLGVEETQNWTPDASNRSQGQIRRRGWEGRVWVPGLRCSQPQFRALGAGRGGARWGGAKPGGLWHRGQSQSRWNPSHGTLLRESPPPSQPKAAAAAEAAA